MNLKRLVTAATNKTTFKELGGFISFCSEYLRYVSDSLQATIISQNENQYCFYQYGRDGKFQITRPINSSLMYDAGSFQKASADFLILLRSVRSIKKSDKAARTILNNCTYTIQQSIGAALDALPTGKSNTARKLNGDIFEHFVRLIVREIGIPERVK